MGGLTALVLAASFGTVSVTNHAGFVLSGELTSVTNGQCTIGGRAVPLKVLKAADRRRVQELVGCDTRTPKERRMARLYEQEKARIAARAAAGLITAEQAELLRREAEAAAAFRREQKLKD